MKTKNNYYAFAHSYGSTTHVQGAPHGDGGQLQVFGSKSDRDAWVDGGPGYQGDTGARVIYPSSKVRAHVVTGEYLESEKTTRELVDAAHYPQICDHKKD